MKLWYPWKSICASSGVRFSLDVVEYFILKGTSSYPIVIHIVPLDLGTHRLTVRLTVDLTVRPYTNIGIDEVFYHLKVEVRLISLIVFRLRCSGETEGLKG